MLLLRPVTVLCFNDPAIPAAGNFDALPQGLITGPAYPVMIQRTGWDISEDSRDMLAFFKGAGYHSGNHQHLDAGHFEIFFREPLIVDLGVYHFYGTPYDFNFNKRAAAHNILTVCGPAEKSAMPAVSALRTADTHFEIAVGRQLLVLSREYGLTGCNLAVQVGSDTERVLLAGFKPGRWRCAGYEFEIKSGEHAVCLKLPAGKHELVRSTDGQ